MTDYKAIFIDIDMTLTGPDRHVSPANVRAVHAAMDAGVEVVLCTGRNFTEAVPAIEEIEMPAERLIVCVGGAMVSTVGNGRPQYRRIMEPDLRDATTAVARDLGIPAMLLQDTAATGYDYLLLRPDGDWPLYDQFVERTVCRVRTERDWTPGDDDTTLRVSMVETGTDADQLRGALVDAIGGRAHWHDLWYPDSQLRLLEVFGADVNKGSAMRWVCDQRGWPIEWIAAIGDDINDLPMMTAGGLGVAMGNAHEQVRRTADVVTAGHDEDGAAAAIARLLDGEFDALARGRESA